MTRLTLMVLVLLATVVSANPWFRGSEIHDAARRGDVARVRELIDADASAINKQDEYGDTPLSIAAAYGRWNTFEFLLREGAEVNTISKTQGTALHCVCYHDRPDMLRLLFSFGCQPSMKVRDIYGEYSPLLRAVQRGGANTVSALFELGANPEDVTKEGWNALHLAALCGHQHLYEILKQNGVRDDARDGVGNLPIDYDWTRPGADLSAIGNREDYVGRYVWQGKADGPGVTIFLEDGSLFLDDASLNELYPVQQDGFYCSNDPWWVTFERDGQGQVNAVELQFLRRAVLLEKTRENVESP